MKAMILAAGFGTRLKPLTDSIPKAMININGIPVIGIVIRRLIYFGATDIIINLHYIPGLIISYVENLNFPGVNFHFSPEDEKILDTGGAIRHARELLDDGEPFIVHNSDVISDIDLSQMFQFHRASDALATLAVKGKKSERCLLFDQKWQLAGWENHASGEKRIARPSRGPDLNRIGFCGIHVISPEIFRHMPGEDVFSIITTYMKACGSSRILGFPVEKNLWIDIGSHSQLEEARRIDPAKYLPEITYDG